MIYLNGKIIKAYWGGHWHKAAYLGSQLVWQNTVQREVAGDAKITLTAGAEVTAAYSIPLNVGEDGQLLTDARIMSTAATATFATEKLESPYNAGLRIGKLLLSDDEHIALGTAAKSVASTANSLQVEAANSMIYKGKAYAQKLLKPALLMIDAQCCANGVAIVSKRVKAVPPVTVKYKGKAYAQKLLKPALLMTKVQQAAEASSLPAKTMVSDDKSIEIKYKGKAYAQKLLKPAILTQTMTTLAQENALLSAPARSDIAAQFKIRSKMYPPAAKEAIAVLQVVEKLYALPRGQPSTPLKGTEVLSQCATARTSSQPSADAKACSSVKSSAAALPETMTKYTGKLQGSAVTEATATIQSADVTAPTVNAGIQTRNSAVLEALVPASQWVAPVQIGTKLKITSVYEATQTGSKLIIH